MSSILELERERLMKEFLFVQADYEYKWSLVQKLDTEFSQSVRDFLTEHPKLKEVFEDKNSDAIASDETSVSGKCDPDQEDMSIGEDGRIKSLYRKIAKETHPDKTDNSKLKELYLKATKAYEKNEIPTLLSLCEQLQISYEFEPSDRDIILSEIQNIRAKVQFLENTYTYKWYMESYEEQKDRIILTYISNNMGVKIN